MLLTLDLLSYIIDSSFYHVLSVRQKVPKNSARGRTIRLLLLFVNCPDGQYHSSVVRSPFQAFLLVAGCCGTHFVWQFLENIIATLRLNGLAQWPAPIRALHCAAYGAVVF